MPPTNRSRNRALLDFVVLPFLFLTVALLGGLRIGAENGVFIFIAPPLVTLFARNPVDAAPGSRWSTEITSMGWQRLSKSHKYCTHLDVHHTILCFDPGF
jgi:hypothetical protein